MLDVRGLSGGYGRLRVLFDVDLRVGAGEFVAVLGPNGAGKSTLLKTILGLIPAWDGSITFDGQRLSHQSASERFRMGMSMAPEGRRIFKSLTVDENLVAGSFGRAPADIDAARERCFDLFPRLRERRGQRAGSMSGGEQQMLAISRALMSDGRLLMVDELSLGLAPLVVEEVLRALRRLCDQGLAVIAVDQFAAMLLGSADRAYVLEKGRVEFSGTPGEAVEQLDSAYIGHDMLKEEAS